MSKGYHGPGVLVGDPVDDGPCPCGAATTTVFAYGLARCANGHVQGIDNRWRAVDGGTVVVIP